MLTEITSEHNKVFKSLVALNSSKGIRESGLCVLSGTKLIEEYFKSPNAETQIEFELASTKEDFRSDTRKKILLQKNLLNQINVVGASGSIFIVSTPKIEKFNFAEMPSGLEIVCPVGDPLNVGAIARSALAFGASKLILTSESANPFLPKSIKASAGAVFRIPIFLGPSLSEISSIMVSSSGLESASTSVCKNTSDVTFVFDKTGVDISDVKWPRDVRIVVGEEGLGIKKVDQSGAHFKKVSIPMVNMESLNVAVTAGIALFEYRKQHKNSGA